MSIYKKLVVIVFVTVFMIVVLPFTVFAEDAVEDTSPKVVEITIENFPDNRFFNSVKSFDTNKDGWISQSEADNVKSIWLGMLIKDCTGIEYFTELKELRIGNSQDLKKIDLSHNTKLEDLNIGLTGITNIDLSLNTALKSLYLPNNKLTSLDLSNNTNLTYLDCDGNQISELIIDKCINLESIDCSQNQISGYYDLRNLTKLETVNFSKNPGARIMADGMSSLTTVIISDTGISSFSIADCPKLNKLYCFNNVLSSIAVSNCPVTELLLDNNHLENLDDVKINSVRKLRKLEVENNRLNKLDTSSFENLEYLTCSNNEIASLNFDNNKKLYWLECANNKLKSLKIIDEEKVLQTVICSDNPIENLELSSDNLQNVVCENAKLTTTEKIVSPKLLYLNVNNNLLTNVDMSVYPNLMDLFCNGNKLAKLVLNPDIWRVYCENNNLTAIDASEATHISYTYSTDNYCIWASGNALYIEPDKNRRYDLSRLTEISGFDVNRAANWNGGSVDGNILTVDPGAKKVTYTYIIKEKNSLGNPVSETFTLNLPENECTHTNTLVVGAKTPTCTAKGYTGDVKCKDCGHILKKGVSIAANGHKLKTVIKKATITDVGRKSNICTVCKKIVSQSSIAKVANIKLNATNFVFDGKIKTPVVTVKDSNGKILKKNIHYSVTYAKGRKNVGRYAVVVKLKGNYSGTKILAFNIIPKRTSIYKLTAGKTQFTAKWYKQTIQTTGYELQYSIYPDMLRANTVVVRNNKLSYLTVKKLKTGKKYYVRIRTYKIVKVNGKNVKLCSYWSNIKSVKTK